MKSFYAASAALALMFSLSLASVASADETPAPEQGHHHHHHHGHHHRHMRKAFRLGVCVGQTLASQGIMLPAPVAGQHPKLDDATRAALKAAVKTCKAAMFPQHSESADQSQAVDQTDETESSDSLVD